MSFEGENMNFEFSPDEERLRRELRNFLAENLPEDWVGVWQSQLTADQSAEITEKMADLGWLTYCWSPEFGGRGGTIWDQVVIQEELFAHHEPRGSQYMGVNWIGPVLMEYGTEDQQRRYLPEIASGHSFWAQLFSEPDAGSDLASLRTLAIAHDDEFVVNGEKIWTSYANTARHGFLLARTDPSAERHRGLSVFLIDMATEGIEVREIPSTVGWHRFHSTHFNDVRIPRSALLGELNQGWSVAMAALPYERIGNARYARTTRSLGLLERMLNEKDQPLGNDIADALALGRMAELLNHRVAGLKDSGSAFDWQASAAFASNAIYEQEVAGIIEDRCGYYAYVSNGDERALAHGEIESFVNRQAPTVTIQAGSYQVQLSLIGRNALGLPRTS
jgi:alkylation response protein AidB-like acyl-CoA dehydrogenase